MIDITVKTLDGQNRAYCVPEDTTVKQFKEKIAGSINITADTQRLIFQGKVLQDDKMMKDYDVHGKVVHVVVRPPPSTTRPSSTADNPQPNTTTPGRDVNSIVVGSFTLPSDILDANMVQGIARDAIMSMGEMGRNARVTTRTSADGSALDVHIHLGPVSGQTVSEAQMRLNTARTMIRLANDSLERLETSTPTNGSRSGTPRSSSPAPSREAASNSTETESTETPSRLSPMDISEEPSSSEPSTERVDSPVVGSTQTETETSTTANQSEATSSSSQSGEGGAAAAAANSTNEEQQNGQPRPPVRPNITALAEVLTDFNELNNRLQPHMQRFTQIVRSDAEMNAQEQRENQRVCNHVGEVMHAFSHGYHALSDLMVDLSQARPRRLYVTLAIAHPHTTVIQQTIPVQVAVPIARNVSSTSTASTGTSTNPNPNTTETGTQPSNPPTTETGTQPSAGTQGTQGEGDDLERISQEMRAGLQNVLGQNLHQGDGSPDNPYVFVEMGPDRMTVNSISAQVVTSTEEDEESGSESSESPAAPATTTNATPPTTTTTTTAGNQAQFAEGLSQAGIPQNIIQGIMQMAGAQQGQTPQGMMINIGQGGPGPRPGMPGMPGMGFRLGPHGVQTTGLSQAAGPGTSSTFTNVPPASTMARPRIHLSQGAYLVGLPPNLRQNITRQTLQQAGGQPQRMQINIGQGTPPMGFRLGPVMMRAEGPGLIRNESGTQTAGANGVPSNSGTQTLGTPTSTFGTQTSTASSTPSSTSGTQTPSAPTAFMMPGGAPAGIPGALGGLPGPGQGLNPADPYLPCSSRHFLTRHATNILNNAGGGSPQNNDTVLADMVGNLMSGLLGGATGTRPTTSAAASSTSSGSDLGSGANTQTTGGTGQPRPATTTNSTTYRMGTPQQRHGAPLFRGPITLGNIFPGRMPQLTGMRFRVQTPRAGPPPQQAPASSSTQQSTGTTATSQTSTSSTGSAPGGEPMFVQMLRTMLSQSNQRPGTGTTQATSTTPSSTAGTPASTTAGTPAGTTTDQNQNVQTGQQSISDEAFTQLVSGLTNYMSQAAVGQAPAQTIGDFIRNLGENYTMPQGEGFINDALSCVLGHLQITDMLQLLYGNAGVLNQVQAPLREFLTSRVLEDGPLTEDNMRMGVADLMESMQSDIQEMVNSAAPRPHIDFLATTNRFLSQQLFNVVFLILNSRDGDTNFGRDLYACVRRLFAEMFVLCSRCLGGMPQVEQFVHQRLRNLTTNVNPLIQEWMSAVTRNQLSSFIPTITVTEGEVGFYLVNKRPGQPSTASAASKKSAAAKKNPEAPSSSSTSASAAEDRSRVVKESAKRDPSPLRAPSPKRLSKEKEVVKSPMTPMETSPLTSSPGASEMEVEPQKQSQTTSNGAEASAVSQSKTTPSTENQPSPSGAQASSNGDWQGVVPADWVPVITRDIASQKSQSKQAPYSDVYLQGMPPKRRRLMTQDRPTNISNTSEVLPDSLRRAVAAAAVEPISNMDNLISEVHNDAELQNSFDSQVSSTISDRLNQDTDYKEERFPGSTEYFHKTNDKKK